MDGGHNVSGFISGEFRQWRTIVVRTQAFEWMSYVLGLVLVAVLSSVVVVAWLDDNARKATDVKRLVSGPRSALAFTHRSVLADPILARPITEREPGATSPAQPSLLRPVSGRPITPEGIQAADVLSRVELLRDELARLQFEMGKRQDHSIVLAATNVAPREVIFQAFTLLGKASQLHHELNGTRPANVQIRLPRTILPFHVWTVVNGAYEHVRESQRSLGMTKPLDERLQPQSVTPSEVFNAIMVASRQFDRLIWRGPRSADVFLRVTEATLHAQRLVQQFGDPMAMPAAPALEHGKRPAAVYDRLLECFALVRAIIDRSGIEALHLTAMRRDNETDVEIGPPHVYDLSTLIVSELAYLENRLALRGANVTPEPGPKLPSHVHQRAGILLRQLKALEKHVQEHPNWLSKQNVSSVPGRYTI